MIRSPPNNFKRKDAEILSKNKRDERVKISKDSQRHLEIYPDLSECVETKARKEHNRLSSLLLSGSDEVGLIEQLKILHHFLDAADFRALRSESERLLIEGRAVKFILSEKSGEICYEMKIEG